MLSCTINPVNLDNLPQLLDLLRDFALEFISEECSIRARNEYKTYFTRYGISSRLPSLLLYKNEIPIGCGQIFYYNHPPFLNTEEYIEGEVYNLYVTKNERNKGYGKLLLDALFDLAKSLNIKCLRLNSSPDAERFYERNGFKVPVSKAYIKWEKSK